jgi:hypothetical protein
LLAGVAEFFSQRISGPSRRELLAADLGEVDERAEMARRDNHAAVWVTPADDSIDTLGSNVVPLFTDGAGGTGPRPPGAARHRSHVVGAPGLPECEPRAVGRGAGDQPGGSARQGPPCGVLGVRGIHRVATTVAMAPASTVASPERSTLSRPKCQRVATPPPPVANPDSLGLFS